MEITVKTKIGKTDIIYKIADNNEMEALHKAAVLGSPKLYCDECQNQNADFFRFDSNKDQEAHIYVNIVCRKCGAKAKLGQYKAGGYFWHKFKKYQKEPDNNSKPNEEAPPEGNNAEEELPF